MELEDKRDLERFFSNLTREDASGGTYQDLEFEVIDPGSGVLILAFLLGALGAIVDRVIGMKRPWRRRWGRKVRVFFPKPLRLDLWIESRVLPIQDDDLLRASFYWPGISEDIVSKLFEGTIRFDLLHLGSLSHILITNEWLQCKPLPRSPSKSAEVLDRAVQIVKGLNEIADHLKPTPGELDEKA